MKKLMYSLTMACTMLCAMATFTACNSDEDPTIWDTFHPQETYVMGEYVETTATDIIYERFYYELNVKKSTDTSANVDITQHATDGNEEASFHLKDAYIEQKGTDVVITGNAQNVNEPASFKITYTKDYSITMEVTRGKKSYTLNSQDQRNTASLEVVGYWHVDADTNKELAKMLDTVVFTEFGQIYTKYREDASSETGSSETGSSETTQPTWKIANDLARYNVTNGYHDEYQISLMLNTDKLLSMAMAKDEATKQAIQKVQEKYNNIIPVNLQFDYNDTIVYLKVDEDIASIFAGTKLAFPIRLER